MGFTKKIRIQAKELQGPKEMKQMCIVLGFNQDAIKTSTTPFSGAAWKVSSFYLHKLGHQHIDLIFNANFGVCKVQAEPQMELRVEAGIDMPISIGQQIDLLNDETPQFDNTATYSNAQGFAINNKITDETVTIGAGLYNDEGDDFCPIAVWQDVGNGTCIDIQFTPIISIFSAPHFVEGQLFPGHIDSLLWNHDLADANLPKSLVFDLVWQASLNKFSLALHY